MPSMAAHKEGGRKPAPSVILSRSDFQAISRLRQSEAAALLKAGLYDGAYYLAGYSVECALKACIAKQTRRHDFPHKDIANKVWIHDLKQLIRWTGLGPDLYREMKANEALGLNWAEVKDWTESARYEVGISEIKARGFYSACTARTNGILSWIRKRW